MLDASVSGGACARPTIPTRSARVWAALACPTSGEVLLSAAPGVEFVDWGGQAHVGGGSHGSLHAGDSHAPLICCGLDRREPEPRAVVDRATSRRSSLRHFGL